MAEGNVIIVGADTLEVARACNGLSMLLSFVTLITATVLLVRRPIWERVVLLASAIPIALISNILRIAVTAWCYHRFGRATGDKLAHDAAGWAMMPLALALVYLELRVLSWLFVEVEEVEAPVDRLAQGSGTGSGKSLSRAVTPRGKPVKIVFFNPIGALGGAGDVPARPSGVAPGRPARLAARSDPGGRRPVAGGG